MRGGVDEDVSEVGGGKEMKQFLYLDIDIVNSIIAQAEKGLVQSISSEQSSSESESEEIRSNIEGKGTVGGSLINLAKAEANLTGKLEGVESGTSVFASRDIISKTLHDAAFDIAHQHIKPTNVHMGDDDQSDTGSYIELARVFDFVDFDYLEGLFSTKEFVNFLKKNSAGKIKKAAESARPELNRTDLRKAGGKIKEDIEKAISIRNNEFDEIGATIKVIKCLIPYNRMLVSHDGYLIPLDDKFFRVNPVNLGFKYGGEITCVGMVSNIIGKDTDSCDRKNFFATLQFMINEVLRGILPTPENNLIVIHPIAVYYGE